MKFFTPTTPFTHKGSFYAIPIYLNLDEEEMPMIAGTNIITSDLFYLAVGIHNNVIELGAQVFSSLFNTAYQPGFRFSIKEEL